MSIDLEAISARAEEATPVVFIGLPMRKENIEFFEHAKDDMTALLAEVERLNEENKTLSDYIDVYTDICDQHQKTHHKLMDNLDSVTAERDAEKARADKAEDDIEILSSHLDPCEICESKRNCVHPASCPERNHSSFRYCGHGKEQNDG